MTYNNRGGEVGEVEKAQKVTTNKPCEFGKNIGHYGIRTHDFLYSL